MSEIKNEVRVGELVVYQHGEHAMLCIDDDWWNAMCMTREEAARVAKILQRFSEIGDVKEDD